MVLLLAGALSAALLGAVCSELGRVGSDRALVLHLSENMNILSGPVLCFVLQRKCQQANTKWANPQFTANII